jgi:hypothetical protein
MHRIAMAAHVVARRLDRLGKGWIVRGETNPVRRSDGEQFIPFRHAERLDDVLGENAVGNQISLSGCNTGSNPVGSANKSKSYGLQRTNGPG